FRAQLDGEKNPRRYDHDREQQIGPVGKREDLEPRPQDIGEQRRVLRVAEPKLARPHNHFAHVGVDVLTRLRDHAIGEPQRRVAENERERGAPPPRRIGKPVDDAQERAVEGVRNAGKHAALYGMRSWGVQPRADNGGWHDARIAISPSAMNAPAAALAPAPRPATPPDPELTGVVPTFKEHDNVPLLVEKLARTLAGVDWEVVFVDDNSPDGTAAVARAIGETDARVRCVRRIGRRGLAGACIEGMLASQARYVAVMDADLQHDETLLTAMLAQLRHDDVELAVASRYLDGGSAAGLSSAKREQASRLSTAVARKLLGVTLTDPMSGFFMMRRDRFEERAPRRSSQGFKILLDIVATARGSLRIAELPFVFAERRHGESKLDSRVALDFAALVLAKLTNDAVSFRFLLFCLVGLTGIAIHMAVLQV